MKQLGKLYKYILFLGLFMLIASFAPGLVVIGLVLFILFTIAPDISEDIKQEQISIPNPAHKVREMNDSVVKAIKNTNASMHKSIVTKIKNYIKSHE